MNFQCQFKLKYELIMCKNEIIAHPNDTQHEIKLKIQLNSGNDIVTTIANSSQRERKIHVLFSQ